MRLERLSFTRSLLTIAVTAALGLTTQSALAAADHAHQQATATENAPNDAAAEARQQAVEHTQALIALQKKWSKAQGAGKSNALEQLVAKAEERRKLLNTLMEIDPAELLRVAIPEEKQSGMPAEVRAKLEQRLELSGELEVFYEDHEDGTHRLRHVLNTDFGERFEMHFAGKAPELANGQRASMTAVLLEADDSATEGDVALSEETLILAAGSETTSSGTLAASTSKFGEQSTLVVNINFSDNTKQPWTTDYAQNMVFGTIDSFIRENSFGQTWLNGTVTPWLTLPLSQTSCDTTAIIDAAKAAATAAGYDLTAYPRRIFAMPYNSSCPFSGVGSVGGSPSSALINGNLDLYTVAHEFGHNLGLYHAHSMDCGSSTIGSSCTTSEYGDSVDIMGQSQGHYNAFQKERLGWLDSSNMTTVTSSGVYNLGSYANDQGTEPKALKISRGTDASTGQPAWYYLEYRKADGFDSLFSNNSNLQNGVVLHSGVENRGDTSYLLDMTPNSASSSWSDLQDAALEVGSSFTDSYANITLATEWADDASAGVNVQVDGSATACSPANPALSVTPDESAWVAAGTSVSYTLTVTNQDSSTCDSNVFSISAGVPSGWSRSLGNSSLTLSPGESATTQITVTSSDGASDGFYAVDLAAASGSYRADSTVTYVVDNPVTAVNNAPIAQNDSASTAYQTAVTLDVLANDSDADGDTLTVSSASSSNGSAIINADGTITFTPANGFSGTASVSYSVSDGQSSDSATVSISVAAAPNNAPVAQSDSASTDYQTPVTINVLANDSDADGDTLSVTAVSGVNGTAVINADGTLTFTPANGFSGSETFSYTVTDGQTTDSATVTVSVAAAPVVANQAPVATDDSASTDANTAVTIAVLGNDSDPDSDNLSIVSVAEGGKGSVQINGDGTLTFTPAKNFKNFDNFSYTISDGKLTASANVTVTLAASSSGSSNNGKGRSK